VGFRDTVGCIPKFQRIERSQELLTSATPTLVKIKDGADKSAFTGQTNQPSLCVRVLLNDRWGELAQTRPAR
jgi:hypothetical protein